MPGDSESVLTITEIVQASTLSLNEMSKRTDGQIAVAQFADLYHGRVLAFPKKVENFDLYAKALGVSPRAILLGFAKQLGVDVAENQTLLATMLPAEAANLTLGQARAVSDLVREIVTPTEAIGGGGRDGGSAPIVQLRGNSEKRPTGRSSASSHRAKPARSVPAAGARAARKGKVEPPASDEGV